MGTRRTCLAQHCDTSPRTPQTPHRFECDGERLIVRENLSLSLFGVTIGLGISAAGAAMLASYLFGVTAGDPATFAGGAVVLCLVSLVATYLPARRAARIDPMVALRYE
jgi:putative ABC transport system permease protein